jgi:hypothetical protein
MIATVGQLGFSIPDLSGVIKTAREAVALYSEVKQLEAADEMIKLQENLIKNEMNLTQQVVASNILIQEEQARAEIEAEKDRTIFSSPWFWGGAGVVALGGIYLWRKQ